MKLIVLVPSKGRSEQLRTMTGSWLFTSGVDYKILVEPQDLPEYSLIVPPGAILELPNGNQGLEYSLLFGKRYAQEYEYDTIFKIDDDIKGWRTMDKEDTKSNIERFSQILADIEEPLENENCGGISFGYRQEFWHDKMWFGINQRFQTCYVVKTELYRPNPKGSNKGMWEDMINFMRVVQDGHKVLRYGKYLMDTRVESGMEGGLTEFYKGRSKEQYDQIISDVQEEFPWLTFRMKKDGRLEPNFRNKVIDGKKL